MGFNLNFLKNVKLLDAAVKPSKRQSGNNLPTEGDIKIFSNGKIYYSPEFRAKVGQGGIDFIDSRKWSMYPKDAPQHCVFVCIVPDLTNNKIAAKVDVRQESTNSPISSVKNTIVPMLWDIYSLSPDKTSVELKLDLESALTHPSEIYHIPKVISTGDAKGMPTYARREKVVFYPALPLVEEPEIIQEDCEQEEEEEFVENVHDEIAFDA